MNEAQTPGQVEPCRTEDLFPTQLRFGLRRQGWVSGPPPSAATAATPPSTPVPSPFAAFSSAALPASLDSRVAKFSPQGDLHLTHEDRRTGRVWNVKSGWSPPDPAQNCHTPLQRHGHQGTFIHGANLIKGHRRNLVGYRASSAIQMNHVYLTSQLGCREDGFSHAKHVIALDN